MKMMKRMLSVCLCGVLIGLCVCGAAWTVRAEETPLRVLAIGNSYSNNCCKYVSRIAASMGLSIEATSLYYPGCSIRQHVTFYEKDDKNYVLEVNGSCNWEYLSLKEALTRKQYDVITFQQSPTDARDFTTYQTPEKPYLEKLLGYVRALQPQATLMVNQTWAACSNVLHGEGRYTPIYYSDGRIMYEEIEAAYRQMAAFIGDAAIIPCGTAVQLAVDDFGYSADYTAAMTVYNDDISHMNHRGEYLTGCVWVEALSHRDCRAATFSNDIADYRILQEVAHEAVSGEQPTVYDGLRAVENSDGMTLLRYGQPVPENGEITLPTAVGGRKLTAIGGDVFKNVEGVRTVNVPETVRKIEKGAFSGIKVNYIKPDPAALKDNATWPGWVWIVLPAGAALLTLLATVAVLGAKRQKRAREGLRKAVKEEADVNTITAENPADAENETNA